MMQNKHTQSALPQTHLGKLGQKKQSRKKSYPIWSMFLLLFFGTITGLEAYALFEKWRTVHKKKATAESQHQTLLEKQKDLEKKNTEIQTDAGKERILREQYRVKSADEDMAVILHNAQ